MKIIAALQNGVRLVNRFWRYLFLAYGLNLVLALVLAAGVGMAIADSLGHSASAERLVQNFEEFWYQSFAAQAKGLEKTFNPTVTGIGAVLNGLDATLGGRLFQGEPLLLGVGAFYLILWLFLSAGFISFYARPENQTGFLAHAGCYFVRFVVLGAMAWILYFLIFAFLLDGLGWLVNELTRETIDERIHFFYTLLKYAIVWLLVLSVNMLFDYSKILTVLRDYRNALTAPLHALRLIWKNKRRTYGLYFTLGGAWLILLLIYWFIAPGAGQSTWLTIFLAFMLGQVYVLSRIWTRALFLAGQTAMARQLTASTPA